MNQKCTVISFLDVIYGRIQSLTIGKKNLENTKMKKISDGISVSFFFRSSRINCKILLEILEESLMLLKEKKILDEPRVNFPNKSRKGISGKTII